jgi:hypothetical protein
LVLWQVLRTSLSSSQSIRYTGLARGLWTFAVFTRGEFVESDTPAGG